MPRCRHWECTRAGGELQPPAQNKFDSGQNVAPRAAPLLQCNIIHPLLHCNMTRQSASWLHRTIPPSHVQLRRVCNLDCNALASQSQPDSPGGPAWDLVLMPITQPPAIFFPNSPWDFNPTLRGSSTPPTCGPRPSRARLALKTQEPPMSSPAAAPTPPTSFWSKVLSWTHAHTFISGLILGGIVGALFIGPHL